jgi:hypothetical protein
MPFTWQHCFVFYVCYFQVKYIPPPNNFYFNKERFRLFYFHLPNAFGGHNNSNTVVSGPNLDVLFYFQSFLLKCSLNTGLIKVDPILKYKDL